MPLSDQDQLNFDYVRDFLATSLAEQFPELTLRKGTAFGDVLDLVSYTYSIFRTDLDDAQQILSLQDYETLDPAQLDAMLANWGKFRNQGTASTGTLRLYFSKLETVSATANTHFSPISQSTLTYIPVRTYSFNSTYFLSHIDQGYYYCDIEVTATTSGESANIDADMAFTVSGLTGGTSFNRAFSLIQFSGGVDAESNTDFYNRAIATFISREQTARGGVKSLIQTNFAWAKDIMVVAPGDKYMLRDVVLDLIDFPRISPSVGTAWVILTFLNKMRGDMYIPHVAYKFQFPWDPEEYLQTHTIDDFEAGLNNGDDITFDPVRDELLQYEYNSISQADANSMIFGTGIIFKDDFDRTDLSIKEGQLISSEYIIIKGTCETIVPSNDYIQDDTVNFTNEGVLAGDIATILTTNEDKLGSSGSPIVADDIDVAEGTLTDASASFLPSIKIGDTLHLQKVDTSWVTTIILNTSLHVLTASIASASYNNNYYITSEVDANVDFKITSVEDHKLHMDLLDKYAYDTAYSVKRNKYEMLSSGWHSDDLSAGAVNIVANDWGHWLCLGWNPDNHSLPERNWIQIDLSKRFEHISKALGKKNAQDLLAKISIPIGEMG